MEKMSDLINAFDEVQNGKTNKLNFGTDEKHQNAKNAYLEMIGETPAKIKEKVKDKVLKEDVTESSKVNKLSAALQVIRETADTYDNAEEAFLKIEKIVNACK